MRDGVAALVFQAVPPDSAQPLLDGVAASTQQWSILDLLAQAGGFQWPILLVLVAGLMTLALSAVRTFLDDRAARSLQRMNIQGASMEDFTHALAENKDTLYRRALEGMCEVWHSVPEPSALGYESHSVINGARTMYMRTQRMVVFLSSTAGGLGLLGTLVGIYALFSAEARDAQTIFAGIAIAIVSTLLGIIVSIVLEFLEALLHSWTSKYMATAEEWSADVRYRLLALKTNSNS